MAIWYCFLMADVAREAQAAARKAQPAVRVLVVAACTLLRQRLTNLDMQRLVTSSCGHSLTAARSLHIQTQLKRVEELWMAGRAGCKAASSIIVHNHRLCKEQSAALRGSLTHHQRRGTSTSLLSR